MKKSLPTNIPRTTRLLKTRWGDVSYRAWGLGDQSKLLLAMSGKPEASEFYDALLEILESCVVKYTGSNGGDLDVKEMPLFLSELVLAKCRAISIGEVSNLTKDCDCKEKVAIELDLSKAEIASNGETSMFYTIGEYTFNLRYPSFRGALEISDIESVSSITEELLRKFVHSVYTEDSVWVMSDYTAAEQNEFMQLLGADFQLHIMNSFVKNMPYVSIRTTGVCTGCGKDHGQEIKGISKLFHI